jgi:hypothetical protein
MYHQISKHLHNNITKEHNLVTILINNLLILNHHTFNNNNNNITILRQLRSHKHNKQHNKQLSKFILF